MSIAAGVALLLGTLVCFANWSAFVITASGRRNVSAVPLVGGVLLTLGLLGFESTRPWAWLGFVADWGTVALVLSVPVLIHEFWSTSRFNLRERFVASHGGREYELRLFARAIFTVRVRVARPARCCACGCGTGELSMTGSWRGEADQIVLEGYGGARRVSLRSAGAAWVSAEEFDDRPARGCTFSSLDALTWTATPP